MAVFGFITYAYGWTNHALIAEDTLNQPTTIIGALVGGFTLMTALMAWVVKHLLDTTVPNMQNNFQTTMSGQKDTFEKSLADQQKLFVDSAKIFQEIVASQQESSKKELVIQIECFNMRQDKLKEIFENALKFEREANAKNLELVMAEFRIDRERFFDVLVTAKEEEGFISKPGNNKPRKAEGH